MTRAIRWLSMLLLTTVATAAAAGPGAAGPLADGVLWLPGHYGPERQPDGNSVLFAAPGGWVVVDSGRHPAHAQALLALAGERPIHTVVNSHWHLDHVGGNPALRAAHPRLQVIASPAIDAALDGFLADYAAQLRERLARDPQSPQAPDWRAEVARIDGGAALRPEVVVTEGSSTVLAGRDVQIGFEANAVTGGDLWLLDPASGVLAAGDLVTLPAPFFDTACPGRWQKALARLSTVEFTTLVPGHGAPMTPADFARYRSAFDGLLACAAGDAADAVCVDGWLAAAGPLLTDADAQGQARGLLEYYLPTVLRHPDTAARCPTD